MSTEESKRPARISSFSRAFFTDTGRLAWKSVTKLGSGIATAIGAVSFIVSLGVRYGELQETVKAQTMEIQQLTLDLRELRKRHDMQTDRLAYAIKAQNDLVVNLRIAVAAMAAVDEARRHGRYDREQVFGPEVPPKLHTARPDKQAKLDAKQALKKASQVDPLAALKQLDE